MTEEIDDPIQLQAGDALLCADGTAAAEVSGVENLKGACDVFNFSSKRAALLLVASLPAKAPLEHNFRYPRIRELTYMRGALALGGPRTFCHPPCT